MKHRLFPFAFLFVLGMAWGLSMPMTKLAVSTGHRHFGLIFWQLLIVAGILTVVSLFQKKKRPLKLYHLRLLLIVALAGTLIPNSFSYVAAANLPSGVLSIVMSLIPMSALPMALMFRNENFQFRRLAGLTVGAVAMVVLIAPETSLPDPTKSPFVALAILSTFCYAFEGNYVARFGLDGLDPVQVLLWSSVLGVVILTPVTVSTGQMYNPLADWRISETALLASSFLHALAYVGYIWIVGRVGPVFAAQISYVVTIFGVLFAMVLLGERYSGYVWLSFALVLVGLFLVQPKPADRGEGQVHA